MGEMKDYVDIKKDTPLAPEQIKIVLENPSGWTKEGVEKKIEMWDKSINKFQKRMFKEMLTRCKNLTSSGKTVDGKVIYARKNGKITWTSDKPE